MSTNAQAAEALRSARACILTDRTSMADTGMDPSGAFDPDTATALAEYDAVIQQIDSALAALAKAKQAPAWECKAGGLKPLTEAQYAKQPERIKKHYTRIAAPTAVPLTADELDAIGRAMPGGWKGLIVRWGCRELVAQATAEFCARNGIKLEGGQG